MAPTSSLAGSTRQPATGSTPDASRLAELARRLRALHRPGDPLVLVNVWDAASARQVESAGARALATSSRAVADALGVPDDDTMGAALAFDAVRRVAAGAGVPVTADIEAGYGLGPDALVDGLLGAGAVGCNLEDSDHRRPGELVAAEAFADRLADVRAAAGRAGVEVVVNARIDTFLHADGRDQGELVDEAVRRARLYRRAGADCAYPIALRDAGATARFVAAVPGPVNLNLHPATSLAELAAAGAARVSVGPTAQALAMAELGRRAAELLGQAPSGTAP